MAKTRPRYTQIPETQKPALKELEQMYPGLRFDTGFLGSVPVQAQGKLGSRWFYFRFRYDCASLTVGSPDTMRENGRLERSRRKARRKLRRQVPMDDFDRLLLLQDLEPGFNRLEHFPQHQVRASCLSDVTGERYAGSLEDEEAVQLFAALMDTLQPVPPPAEPMGPRFFCRSRRGRTPRSETGRHVITKIRKK